MDRNTIDRQAPRAHAADGVSEPTSVVSFTVPTSTKRRWMRAARRGGRDEALAAWVVRACDRACEPRCPECGGETAATGAPDPVTGGAA
jgi:hypothetical protein